MGISADVLASALQDLMPGYTEMFTSWHPVMKRIVEKGNITRGVLEGPYREFTVVQGGPGDVTTITHGSEVIAGGRNQTAVRGNEYAPRMIYAFDVPGKDLAEANGKQDLARIIKAYPELGLMDFHERIAQQIVQGNGSNVTSFFTFNGNQNYTPDGNTRPGAFSYLAPASQTGTVHGLNKATVTGWQNQFGTVSSFPTDGRSEMRKLYYQCNRQGSKVLGKVDLMLGDEASYLAYLDDLDDQIRVTTGTTKAGDAAPADLMEGVKFLNADFFLEDAMDMTDTTAWPAAQQTGGGTDGVIYFLNTDTWHMFTLGRDSGKETKGNFDMRGPFRLPEQDLWRYELVLNMGMHTTSLRNNGMLVGAGA